ncbi:MAG: PaaI family thioesterase [Chloroflexi bacterium]|nr:PaaI family thioesterase [Chloroflexota bacterium]
MADSARRRAKQPNSKHCFVCGVENHQGLQLAFYHDESGTVYAEATVPDQFQGYPGTVHGGIVAALLDEVATRAAMVEDPNDFKVTASMTLRYRKKVPTGERLKMIGWIEREGGSALKAAAEIRLSDGSLGAEVKVLLVDYPEPFVEGGELDRLGWKVYPD